MRKNPNTSGRQSHRGDNANRIVSLFGTNPNSEPLYWCSHERKQHDEPEPTRPAEPDTGPEPRPAARRWSETRPAEPGSRQGRQKSQRAAGAEEQQRYVTDRNGPLRRAVFSSSRQREKSRRCGRGGWLSSIESVLFKFAAVSNPQ